VEAPQRSDWVAVGSGWDAHLEALLPRFQPARVLHHWQIHARDVAAVGEAQFKREGGVPVEQALPVYLRNRVARKPGAPEKTG
jgi:tRNA threonylcarbamoyladenosine biosynthesis protein TsaB